MTFWKTATEPDSDGVSVKSSSEYAPKFERAYAKTLNNRCKIIVTIKNWYGLGLSRRGELTQPDGRCVFFDPERIADKILDPTLVPLVQAACDEIADMDKRFRASRPSEFTDERGEVWVRKSSLREIEP